MSFEHAHVICSSLIGYVFKIVIFVLRWHARYVGFVI